MVMNRMQSLVSGTAARQCGNLTGRIVRMAWAPSVLSHPQHPLSVERPNVEVDAIKALALRAGRLDAFRGGLRQGTAARFAGYPVQVTASKRQNPCQKPVGKLAVLAKA